MSDIIDIFAEMQQEIRMPVNVIVSTTELISQMCKMENISVEDIQSRMESIRYYCSRINHITECILTSSDAASGKIKLNCSNENIETFFMTLVNNAKPYLEAFKTSISVKTKLKNSVVCCDYVILEEIIMNLLSNAVKYNDKQTKKIDIFLPDRYRRKHYNYCK